VIGQLAVRCVTAQSQMQSHSGQQVDAKDWHDVLALHHRFRLDLSEQYRNGTDWSR